MRMIGCMLLFIFATLVRHSADASCGTRKGEHIWDASTNTSVPTNITEFQENLNGALDQLHTNLTKISLYKWAGVYSGYHSNAAYTQGRCMWDVDDYTCQKCIETATAILKDNCAAENNSAFAYHEHDYGRCMVQYSNHNMLRLLQMPNNMVFYDNNSEKVDPANTSVDIHSLYAARKKMFDTLTLRAKYRLDGYRMFAVGKLFVGSSEQNSTIYGHVECSPDLLSDTCGTCLGQIGKIQEKYFNVLVGGYVVGPSCHYQYKIFDFLKGTSVMVDDLSSPLPSPPPSSTQPATSDSFSSVQLSPLSSTQPPPPSTPVAELGFRGGRG